MGPGRAVERGGLIPSAVLGVLGTRGPTSRAELARSLEVSSALVTQVTKSLLQRGLVVELNSVPSQGGRPGRLLGLARSAGSAVGVKVTADHVSVVQVGLDGVSAVPSRVRFDPARPDALDQLAHTLRNEIAKMPGRLLGVGVGVPGSVDAQDSGVVRAPTLEWSDAPLGSMLRSRLQLPVLVDNDVNTLAVADRLYGAGQEYSTYLVVTIGRGVGCGVVVDGSVYRGAFGGAGEIGHLPVDYSGRGERCDCGSSGCLEAYIGDAALARTARRAGTISSGQGVEDLAAAARGGQRQALRVFTEAGRMLGTALSGVVHTLDPEVIILSGEGIGAWPLWESGFEEVFRGKLSPRWRSVPFLVEPWDETKWMLGAASLVLSSPFDTVGLAGAQGRMIRDRLQDFQPQGSEPKVFA